MAKWQPARAEIAMPTIDFSREIDALLNRLFSPEIFVPVTLLLLAVITWRSWRRPSTG
jgi:hypothetical protein